MVCFDRFCAQKNSACYNIRCPARKGDGTPLTTAKEGNIYMIPYFPSFRNIERKIDYA